jgi:cytochrome oxidase assembly protein ShyY1
MRLPLVPTLMVAVMVPTMLGLGIWQLERAAWKNRLLADLKAAADRPLVNFDEGMPEVEINFRRGAITCDLARAPVMTTAGRNRKQATGYSVRAICPVRRSEQRILVDAGWTTRPSAGLPPETRIFTGIVVDRSSFGKPQDPRYVLFSEQPVPPLQASAPPSVETIPNNHRGYALQWFAFAATLTVIYLVFVLARRRRR